MSAINQSFASCSGDHLAEFAVKHALRNLAQSLIVDRLLLLGSRIELIAAILASNVRLSLLAPS